MAAIKPMVQESHFQLPSLSHSVSDTDVSPHPQSLYSSCWEPSATLSPVVPSFSSPKERRSSPRGPSSAPHYRRQCRRSPRPKAAIRPTGSLPSLQNRRQCRPSPSLQSPALDIPRTGRRVVGINDSEGVRTVLEEYEVAGSGSEQNLQRELDESGSRAGLEDIDYHSSMRHEI